MKLAQKLRRREFLEGAGTALVGTALGVGATHGGQEPNPLGVRFAAMFPWPIWPSSLFPLPKRYSKGYGLWETDLLSEVGALLGQLGFQGISLGNAWGLSPESILDALEGTGIVVASLGGPGLLQSSSGKARARSIEITRKCLELAKAVQCPKVDDHYLPQSGPFQPDERLVIDLLRDLAPDVKRTGIGIDLEPMFNDKAAGPIDLQSRTVSIIEAVGAPGFSVASDFWHMQMQKDDIGESLARNGNYTGVVHLSEGGTKKTEPGSTGFDYRPGFRALKNWGYSGWLVLECHPSDNNLEASWARGLKTRLASLLSRTVICILSVGPESVIEIPVQRRPYHV